MKTRAAAALAVLLSFVSIATPVASGEETQRYLVATRRPLHAGSQVATFRSVDGFAADLTSSEVAELRRNANVRWIEPIVERHAFAQPARNLNAQTTPYGVDLIEARAAWVAPCVSRPMSWHSRMSTRDTRNRSRLSACERITAS